MKNYFSIILLLFGICNMFSQTFSNTTVSACNTWNSGGAYTGFTKTIAVSGLPNPLSSTGTVLRQINIQLGTSACKGNLSTYRARLVAPDGTFIDIFGSSTPSYYTSTSTSQWMNVKFRDDPSLERINDYTTAVKGAYWPFSIGYYRVDVANSFSNFNGLNPNGNWTLQISEGTVTEVSFERVDLIFGPPIKVNDVTGSSINNFCADRTCLDANSVVRGTNNGYAPNDPNYPGNSLDGCSWNGANNNSGWYAFKASSTSAYLTVSGMLNSASAGSSDMQPIVVSSSGTDCSSGTFSVVTGGCPDDQNAGGGVNNHSYHNSLGGGISTWSNIYSNGITANAEFNLSGLTIGNTYYLYIDGNGNAASSFYIEINSAEDCCSPFSPNLTAADTQTNIGIGTQATMASGFPTSIPSGFIAFDTKTKGLVIPRMTTAQRPAGAAGMIIYNTDLNCIQFHNGTTWKCIEPECSSY
ncbi:hypothetical protein GFJ94_00060 [Flavobacterium sp. LMO8]|uniref:hypothetical protein n=1 Tax=Flavobacterium sp. LMO8 TaxID=2654244 RepID=UPI001291670D|nr:hypothetical protein [Flavobacterium sp. LMO8]MQP23458.1 hypothetical protein [Flavobacterium sp. LMO8]